MIPTYNCAHYLEQTLASVLAQDPGPDVMQIEVVDDASDKDDPEEVVARLGKGRVTYTRQPQNLGQHANLHASLERARGHLVHLLHGDDVVLPGFYGAMDKAFDADAEIGAAFCRWSLMDSEGTTLTTARTEQKQAGRLDDALCLLASEQRIVTPSIVVRRSVWEELGTFDRRLECCEDWEMWVRIAARHPIWYEPEALACYRTHGSSNTGRTFRMAGEARYNRVAIDLMRPLLPSARADEVGRAAEWACARSALGNARQLVHEGDRKSARRHLAAAVRLSRSPRILIDAARILLRLEMA